MDLRQWANCVLLQPPPVEWSLFLFAKKSCEPKNRIKKNHRFCTKTIFYTVVWYCIYEFSVGGYFLYFRPLTNEVNNFFYQKPYLHTWKFVPRKRRVSY